MYLFTLKKHTRYLAQLLTIALLCVTPVSYTGIQNKADASLGILGGRGELVSDISNTLQSTLQALSTAALEQKELVIDGLFFDIAQKALQNMTGDIIKWLNSGLDGDPAFVTDVLAYFQDVSDDTAAEFIYGDELSTICPIFEPTLRENLANKYQQENYGGAKEELKCSIDTNDTDMAAFLGGDFNAGGWSAWFETVLNPTNTSIGANLTATIKLDQKVASAKFAAEKEADWGQGVLSKKTCTTIGTGASAKPSCIITTPGSIMKDLSSKALGTGIDSLLNADEMNEVISALYGNLAKEAVTGINGLLGLGGNTEFSNNTFGVSGSLSFLDAMQEEINQPKPIDIASNKIQQALTTETKVLELQLAIVDEISKVTTLFGSSSRLYAGDSCWNLTLPDALSGTLTAISLKLPTTISTVITLQDLTETYATTTSAAGRLALLEQLSALQSEGLLSGQAAVVEYDYFLNTELKTFIVDFKKKITDEIAGCS